jgi:FAD dependent oxidoreductase/Glucose inhibited division protein A
MKVIIVGGGWSGCAASLSAHKRGAQVVLLERTDMLLGTGLVGGIMRNNGRFTAAEESIAMGGGELFELADRNATHRDIEFPGHRHASLYNVATMEPLVKRLLLEKGTEIHLATRIDDVEMEGERVRAVLGKEDGEKIRFEGDVFIDATGTAGPTANCTKYGNGCAMCILRCPSFGGRVSVAARAGVKEMVGRKGDAVGAMSGSCKLFKESLSQEIVDVLNKTGVAVIPVPSSERSKGKLAIKACQQYALPEYEDNLVLLDTGHAKLMVPFFPLEALRRVPGFENARYEDPYAGGLGNSIRFVGLAPRDDALKVKGIENLFCAGEKAGLLVGHTEAIVTGTLAGHNAARYVKKEKPLILPDTIAIGDAINHVRTRMETEEGLGHKFTFSGSVYFDRLKQKGFYSIDRKEIQERVDRAGVSEIFSR